MRRASVVLLVLALAHAGPELEPTCRCVVTALPSGLRTVAETGLPELDARIRSECGHLQNLFGVEPEFVLLADGGPRKAFVVVGPGGTGTVAVSASWLRRFWDGDHRVATVAATLAHQYAHILQGKRECTMPERSRELHADLLAGWFLGKRNVATLRSGDELDAAFAASLFAEEDEYLNTRFEHGTVEARVAALCKGFRFFRGDKLRLDKVFEQGSHLFPPPSVGLHDDAKPPPGEYLKLKLECVHKGPCRHEVPCRHPQPCVHKVSCKHESPCVHRSPCVHQVPCMHRRPCTHRVACVHRTRCTHKIDCVHTVPCSHLDADGNPIHAFDYLHNFDYEHDWDYEHEFDLEHEFDTEHDYDMAHEFDTEHPFDPVHEFDMAHDWDPIHDHDLAHEWDPLHDYDVRFVPKEAAGGRGDG
jgi:hypothetical protein